MMSLRCPQCGSSHVIRQDFDRLTDSVGLLKLEQTMQLRCECCAWMGFMPSLMETGTPV